MLAIHRRPRLAFFVGTLGAATFIATVLAVASDAAGATDERIRRRFLKAQCPALDTVSAIVTPLMSPQLLIACSLGFGVATRKRGPQVWLPVVSAPFVAMTAGRVFTSTLPRQYAPTPENGKLELSFPSGHTTGATAEALTIACVLRKNGMIGSTTATAIALVPMVEGLNRLYRDRHWASDVVAGLSAGATIAALLCGMSGDTARLTPQPSRVCSKA